MEINKNLLFIDDDSFVISSLKRFLRREDYKVFTAESCKEGLEILKKHEIGVIVSDLHMPGMDGLSFFEQISVEYEAVVKILMTGHATLDSTLDAINRLRLFGYLKKPWPAEELKAVLSRAFEHYNLVTENIALQELTRRQNIKLKNVNQMLEFKVRKRTALIEEALREGIMMLATAAEAKDKETGDHLSRLQTMALAICNGLGIPGDKATTIGLFSIIHDVGKIHVPNQVLNKPGQLSDEEWCMIKTHTIAGERILGEKKFYATARQIARSHHENWDGSGYPDGLKGDEIPLPARIVAVADVFDALINKRPYKDAWSRKDALDEMIKMTGTKFDPDVMDAFLKIFRQ